MFRRVVYSYISDAMIKGYTNEKLSYVFSVYYLFLALEHKYDTIRDTLP